MKVRGSKFLNALRGKKRLFWGEDDVVIAMPQAISHCFTHSDCFNSSYILYPQCMWWKMKHRLWLMVKNTLRIIMDLSENRRGGLLKHMSLLHSYLSASTWFWWLTLLDSMHGSSNKPNQLKLCCSEGKNVPLWKLAFFQFG